MKKTYNEILIEQSADINGQYQTTDNQQGAPDSTNMICSFVPSLNGLGTGTLAQAGFQLTNGSGAAGTAVAIGDVNGDGIGDILIGAQDNNQVYLVLGVINQTNVNLVTNSILLSNGEEGASSSLAVGDVNKDGYADILIGTYDAKQAYLVLGSKNPVPVNLETGAIILSGNSTQTGLSVAIGDVNGDGYGDMLIGTHGGNPTAYLVLGSANPVSVNLDTNSIHLIGGVAAAGYSIAAGDVNGDGYSDMLLGTAEGANPAAYLVLGNSTLSNIDLSSSAIMLNDTASADLAGFSVAIGDVTGDGLGDMLIGAPGGHKVFVVLGSKNPSSIDLNSSAIQFNNPGVGISLAVGNINGDNYGDILLGASNLNQTLLIFGNANLSNLSLEASAVLLSASSGEAGYSVSAGDVNGDGIEDILIGAYADNQCYVVLGNKTPGLSSSSSSSTYVAEMPYLLLNPALQVHENATLTGAIVQIAENYQAAEDTLKVIGLNPNITALPFNTTTGTLTLTGIATATEYQEALERVAYVNTAENPNMQPRTISFQVNDGRLCGISNQFNQTITVLPPAPSIPCSPFVNLNEIGTGTLAAAGFLLTNGARFAGDLVVTGDVNGDGLDDILIGGAENNQVYLVLGSINFSNIDLEKDSIIFNNVFNDTGYMAIGDVNADGYGDMLIGSRMVNQAYLVLGGNNPSSFNLSNAICYYDEAGVAGSSVAIGDVNGDGYADILLGAPGYNEDAGAAYLVLGSANPIAVNLTASGILLSASGRFGQAGVSVAIGDVNRDGYGDMLIGAYQANQAYLVLGTANPSATNLSADAILLNNGSGFAGYSVAIGDVNGDGYGDMLVGALGNQTYLVLGSLNPSAVDLTSDAILIDNGEGDAGSPIAIGDWNGDGYGDIVIGAIGFNINNGAAYLVLGSANIIDINLSESSILLYDSNAGNVGNSVAIGDINGDGLEDIMLGAPSDNQTYVVLGNRTPWVSSDINSTIYIEGASYVLLNSNLQLHENEAQIIGATIQITQGYQSSEDTLIATQVPEDITTLPFNTTSGALSLIGRASAADYQTALANIAYNNTADHPSNTTRTITFQANDGRVCGISNTFEQTLNIEARKPTISPSVSPSNGSGSGSGSNHTHSVLGLILGCSIGLSFLALLLGFFLYKRRQNPGYNLCLFKPAREHVDDVELFEEGMPLNSNTR